MKQTNISVDSEKTQQRLLELWQGLRIKQKQAIRELVGITAQPIYRTQETSNISARLAIAFAQSLNVNPFYITGEVDEPGECSEAVIRELLLKYGYQKLVAEIEWPEEKPAKRKYTRHEKPEPEEAPANMRSSNKNVPRTMCWIPRPIRFPWSTRIRRSWWSPARSASPTPASCSGFGI